MSVKVLEDQCTLVIAGAWNPAILTPRWVAREAMGIETGQSFQVGMQLPINDPSQPPSLKFEGISYTPALNVVVFGLVPGDNSQVEKTINTAARILELLPHTPVTGLGFNSSFEVEHGSQRLLQTFSAGTTIPQSLEDDDASLVQLSWGASIKTHERLLNVSAKSEGGVISITFNVHMEVKSAQEAATRLRSPNLFADIQKDVEAVLEQFTDEAMEAIA